jgi:hypothetical protein
MIWAARGVAVRRASWQGHVDAGVRETCYLDRISWLIVAVSMRTLMVGSICSQGFSWPC